MPDVYPRVPIGALSQMCINQINTMLYWHQARAADVIEMRNMYSYITHMEFFLNTLYDLSESIHCDMN